MTLFGGVIPVTGMAFLMFSLMAITFIGYLLGRVTIKGISLGTAGVFVIALLYGVFFYNQSLLPTFGASTSEATIKNYLKIVETLGLIMFVTAVGFIAGPKFFKNLVKNFKSYILLGACIILAGGLICVLCYLFGAYVIGTDDKHELIAICDGLLGGSLTTTPGFSAAKATVDEVLGAEYVDAVAVGYGIAYLFGVVGVVLFVQLIPKLTHADMDEERRKIAIVDTGKVVTKERKLIDIDGFGLGVFALAAALGLVLGNLKIPLSGKGLSGTCFSLTTTGGCLIAGLILGHFNHIGPVNLMPSKETLRIMRELGLMLFLIGAGIPGGANFSKYFRPEYFIYGALMTTGSMVVGYIIAKKFLKLSLLNNLGSLTGGMTSTPALGTLISVAGTEDVASAYAATYPISLLMVVLVSQFLILIFH